LEFGRKNNSKEISFEVYNAVQSVKLNAVTLQSVNRRQFPAFD